MLVNRTTTVEVENKDYVVGDVIGFTLTDGEEVEAMAVAKEKDGTVFMLMDCLKDECQMNPMPTNEGGYEESDLRSKLNGEILDRFPQELREQFIAFKSGDYLRLPTEKEIFGKNEYGEAKCRTVKQFAPMKLRRNRIAFQGENGNWEWYWLQNVRKGSASNFAIVSSRGSANSNVAYYSLGVRPAFKI